MAIRSAEAVRRAKLYYFLWFVPFFLASVGVGLYARAILPDLASAPQAQAVDAPTELALPLLAMELLPQVFVGVALAGLFAATVSTADSQILVCSGSLTHDIAPRWAESYAAAKIGTGVVTAAGLGIALLAPEGVFFLVLIAWSALGASLGPLVIVRVLGWPLPTGLGIGMMLAGLATVVAWQAVGWDPDVFKMLPGLLVAALVYGVGRIAAWWLGPRQ